MMPKQSAALPLAQGWNQSHLRHFIQEQFQPQHVQANPSWINSVSLRVLEDGTLVVLFPHAYFQEWFTLYLQKDFETFVSHHIPGITGFEYRTQATPSSRSWVIPPFQGDEQHTFDAFLYNAKNSEHVLVAKEMLQKKHWQSTHMLICGPRGCGKTHLLLALANSFHAQPGFGPILVTSCDDLQSLQRLPQEDKERAREEIHSSQAFLLDDVHILEHAPSVQDELLRLFDVFQESGVPMIFSCLDTFSENGGLSPKLHSRLVGGVILHLKKPDLDLRLQFVQHTARKHYLHLTQEEQLTLARRCTDFQSLTQVLFRMVAQRDLRPVDQRANVTQCIEQAGPQQPHPLSCQEIIACVARHFSLQAEELTSHKRHQSIVLARQIAIFLCRTLHPVSFSQIGSFFGGRNHSSIIHAYKRIQSLQKERPDIKSQVQSLLRHCSHH